MSAKPASDSETLARLCTEERNRLRAAGRSLHDDVGPLVSAAGLQLQSLREDAPQVAPQVNQVLEILEQAVEHVRRISQDLTPVPAALWGLRGALVSLETLHADVSVTCDATARPPREVVAALYEAAAAAVAAAFHAGASRVSVVASGKASLSIRVTDNGRRSGRARALSVAALLAHQDGLRLTVSTGKSTIVWIRYAARRSARG